MAIRLMAIDAMLAGGVDDDVTEASMQEQRAKSK